MVYTLSKENINEYADKLRTYFSLFANYYDDEEKTWSCPAVKTDSSSIKIRTRYSVISIPLGAKIEPVKFIETILDDVKNEGFLAIDYIDDNLLGEDAFTFSWFTNLTRYEVCIDDGDIRFDVGDNTIILA